MCRLRGALFFCLFIALHPCTGHAEAAFAYGQWGNGGWASGYATNYKTSSEAQIAAMNSCNARGFNCAIRMTFRKTCFALAVQYSPNNGYFGATRSSIEMASQAALAGCQNMGLACSVRDTACDNVSEEEIRAEENARVSAAYNDFLAHWGACFSSSNNVAVAISECNQALLYPQASANDRARLVQQRDNLISRQRLAAMTSATTAQPDREPVTKSPKADAQPDAPITPIPNSAVSKAVAAITPTISKMIVIAAAFTFVILLSVYAWRSSFPNARTEVQMQYRVLRFISVFSKIVGWVMMLGAGSYFVYALSLLPDTQRGQPWLALPLLSMSAVIATAFAGLLLVAFGEIISALIDMATNSYELKSVARDIRQMLNVTENMATSLRPVQRDDAQ